MTDRSRKLRLASPRLVHAAIAAVLLLAAFSAAGQDERRDPRPDPAQSEPQARYGERISVRLVTVPIVVRDRRGRPIPDLRAEELTVQEGGKTYRIDSLTPLVNATEARENRPKARLITRLGGETRQISTTGERRYMVIVVDLEHDPPTGRKRATEALERFLENGLDPSFQVALLLFDGQLKQLVPFTHDRQALTRGLGSVFTDVRARARPIPQVLMRQLLQKLQLCRDLEMADQIELCLKDSAYEYAQEVIPRGANFIGALEAIVGYMGGLDGQSSVLIVGGSVALNPAREVGEAIRALYGPTSVIGEIEEALRTDESLRPRLDAVMARALRNNVSISFLDRTPAPSALSARQDQQYEAGFRPELTAYQSAQQDLSEIAARTGGSFVSEIRVDEGLRESMKLLESTYYLSFYLQDEEPLTPRRLRRIAVRSSRPGVRLSYRHGVEGARGSDAEAPASLAGVIETGARVRQEIDGVPVDLVPLRFLIDPSELGYEEKGGQAVAQFAVHLKLRETDGTLLADTYRVVTHTYPLELWRRGELEPPAVMAFADVPPGRYVAEAVVTVSRTGTRGILRQQFTAGEAVEPQPPSAGE